MNGLTMDHSELTLTRIIERAERLHAAREIISRAPGGEVQPSPNRISAEAAPRDVVALDDDER